MDRRTSFLRSARGFSLVGTLVAVMIGGLIAALVATLINDTVRGRRTLLDRDEMSEFALFVRDVLTNDATCGAVLGRGEFPVGKTRPLELKVGYGDDTEAVIKSGFTIAGGALAVGELTLEDRSPKAVRFKIGVAAGEDGIREVKVRRHMARVKLQMVDAASGTPHRPRYFEFPVLVNADTNAVEMCNNTINVGDACQAMGFRWDTATVPPSCVVTSACMYGGAYTSTSSGGCVANPATGGCNCPAGFTPVLAGSVNIQRLICAKGCDNFQYDSVYQCFRCPN